MKGMQSEYDFLNLSQNHAVKSNITRDEEIQFTDKINKKDNYFWAQERNIIITNKAIYNLKKFQLKRRIDIKALIGITISKNSDEFVLHCKDLDYDYHFSSPRRKIILDILSNNYNFFSRIKII